MNNDIELIRITERIQEHCQCFDCDDGATIQTYIKPFLNVLARLFCWVDGECDTILRATRQEIIPVTEYEICGCDAMFEFKPYYWKGFDPSTLKVYMHTKNGLKRDIYELETSDYDYDPIDGTIIVNMTDELSPCCRCTCECGCETQYKLVVTYEAGYTADTLPDCVLDALCHFLNIFIAYQNDCGSLDDCSKMDRLAVGSVLASKSVDYLIRTWTIDEGSIDRIYMKLIYRWSFETLSSLSLCRTNNSQSFVFIGKDRQC